MDFNINNTIYHLMDSIERIPSKDSFTHRENKLGSGSGAWEWHVGSKNDVHRYQFFGGQNFSIRCFLKKSDLIWLMNELRFEYQNPSQNYRQRALFNQIWQERYDEVNNINDEYLYFNLREHDNRLATDARLYAKRPGANSYGDNYYGIIRKLMLPNVTFMSILKLRSDDGQLVYYFKIFPESSDFSFENAAEDRLITEIEAAQTIPETEKIQLIKARIGQGLFRNQLLAECPFCPITMVDYPRFLIASHIKPWRDSSNFERLDGKNGILFTPTFDKLFDAGYISFDNQKRLNISPWLSQLNRTRFNIQDGNVYPNFPITGRESYLEYHRNVIFKGTL